MRLIPSIEQLRQRPALRDLEARYGRAAIVDALRAEAAALRAQPERPADPDAASVSETIEQAVAERLAIASIPSLRRVINATGVVLHTNLGRAPLARAAAARVAVLAAGYTNLEYDVERGERGRRDVHAERLLCRITGAAAAVVVNNNAAATLLVLAAMARGREVVISRGELVEIGGGFRVPDVLAQSGAILREVGTTNRTRASDYAAAISERTALILRVHPSNFRIEGFTARAALAELVDLGRRFGVPVAEDVGSGYLAFDSAPAALGDEPLVARSIAAGVDVAMFSGDKLLGGPQAGIIAGTAAAISRIRQHPLMRALRVDKLTYAALEATLEEYAAGRAHETVPVARMLAQTADALGVRANALAAAVSADGLTAAVLEGHSTVGGGSAPGSALPTRLVALTHPSLSATGLERHLRHQAVPVIARILDGTVILDLRTVDPDDDALVADAVGRSVDRAAPSPV
ncbi:MAG: L-seryl-tRNA(Sec) selenium transferase [Acidobacteriota bacterium]